MWVVEASWGDAGEFHHRPFPDEVRRTVWLHQVNRPALVLGSAQPESHVDIDRAESAGLEVCRRRSGGGVVLVQPEDCWIDVFIPSDDQLWVDDVGRAFGWIGDLWAEVLAACGLTDCRVHSGNPENRELGRVLCFGGLGHGEVTAEVNGVRQKVLGLSQRRTRAGARFQGLVPLGPDLRETQKYLAAQTSAGIDVDGITIGAGLVASEVADEFLTRLSAL